MNHFILVTQHNDSIRALMNGYTTIQLISSGLEPKPYMVWLWMDVTEADLAQLQSTLGNSLLGSTILS